MEAFLCITVITLITLLLACAVKMKTHEFSVRKTLRGEVKIPSIWDPNDEWC